MRIIIIGAVAAGTSAAAKARRNSEEADIIIYEKDNFISYSGCGMPYYIGGDIKDADALAPRDSAFFKSKYNVDVYVCHEVISIHPHEKNITVKNLLTAEVFTDNYDKLVLSTGASAVIPPIKGTDFKHVFSLRNINDMNRMNEYIRNNRPKSTVIVGTGFIGLEVCENLKKLGISVTLIDKSPQVTSFLDPDMAIYVEEHLRNNKISLITDISLKEITETQILLSDDTNLATDMILLSTGVQPNVELAASAGIELGVTGAIKVNSKMETNISNIYACGDCIEHFHIVTGNPIYRPLGSTANKTGRIAGDSLTGGNLLFRGVLGTGIFRIFDLTVALTGLSEREAQELGYDIVVCHNIKPNKPQYMGGKEMVIKGIADRVTGRLLGTQIVGYDGVDKRIDIFATAITFKAKVEDLFHLDLAYAPPFSTTKDPVMYTGMILDNALHNGRPLMTAGELDELISTGDKYTLIDARVISQYDKNHIETAMNIPHSEIRRDLLRIDQDEVVITYCNKGVTGNAAQNILLNKGLKKVYNLSGGQKQYSKTHIKERNNSQ